MGYSTYIACLSALLGAGVAYLVSFLLAYRGGHAIGTSSRDDLHSPLPSNFLLGNLKTLQKSLHRSPELILEMIEGSPKDKSPTLTLPFDRDVILRSPEELEWIQYTNFKNYVKGELTHECLNVLGEGIFATDGPIWSAQRKATSKIFTANTFRGLITDSVDETVAKLRAKLADLASSGEPFDLCPLFFAFTLDSFSLLAFGTAIGALSQDAPLPFATAFDFVQSRMMKRFYEPAWKITERFSKEGRRMREETRVLDRFVYDLIDKRAAGGEEKEEDLLSLYMNMRLEDGSKLSRVGVRDAVLNILIAGRDTTAQNLSWIFYHLLTRPEIFAKVRHELETSPPVTYDTYKSLVYLNAVFNEGVRLHPSVPSSFRLALGPDKIANGPRIEKGDFVMWSDWAMGRLTSIWGEDAKEFKPERWIDEDGSLKTASSWKLHGFNGGYRLCLGKTLATFSSITVLSLLVKNFDMSLAPGWLENVEMASTEQTPMYAISLTLPMKHPFMVQARVRDGR